MPGALPVLLLRFSSRKGARRATPTHSDYSDHYFRETSSIEEPWKLLELVRQILAKYKLTVLNSFLFRLDV